MVHADCCADLGATVIKIERPGAGDDTRAWGPPYLKDAAGPRHERGRVLPVRAIAASFRSPSISRAPTGRRIVRDLARQADVLVENFKVGGLAKYGLDYASIAAVNPRLVYASITGFGQDGPYADRAGYDFIIQGMSRLHERHRRARRSAGRRTAEGRVAITDLMTGMYATVAIQAALAHRDRTGEGAVARPGAPRFRGGDDGGHGDESPRIRHSRPAAPAMRIRTSCRTRCSRAPTAT